MKKEESVNDQMKMEGLMHFKANIGRMLPVRYEGILVRITCEKEVIIDWEKCPYDSKAMLRRAYKAGDIIASKGGK